MPFDLEALVTRAKVRTVEAEFKGAKFSFTPIGLEQAKHVRRLSKNQDLDTWTDEEWTKYIAVLKGLIRESICAWEGLTPLKIEEIGNLDLNTAEMTEEERNAPVPFGKGAPAMAEKLTNSPEFALFAERQIIDATNQAAAQKKI